MGAIKQHLIDPEICIRCNTCEATCPVGAITHDDNNYVVDASICNACMDCIAPCPTGSIDNWRQVGEPFSVAQQFAWTELPPPTADVETIDALDDEVAALLAAAHERAGGHARAPASAAKPRVNLYNRANPITAVVTGNFRITAADAESDVRHIILDFGTVPFPVLEGQSIGITPPGEDATGRPYAMRLYSIASPRDGERPNTNNLALTVKRVAERRPDGSLFRGLASNYLCDLKLGDQVAVTGPFGATFLMPDDPGADIIMICTGTGAAPFRGFTERRRRIAHRGPGRLWLFFGARTPQELPYFGPLQKVPKTLLEQELVFSRLPGQRRQYVQHRMAARGPELAELLRRPATHVFLCGLKGLEAGVDEALVAVGREAGFDWPALRAVLRADGRFHAETY
ncbi:MAG: benzoyl-CoA 2,3-epoxidase subunit BoxA [Rhodospirillales bacterium]|nr:benzoyl-CoA 2,3-epoxidase subunit BoxA [Rhodospirillales bacterium]